MADTGKIIALAKAIAGGGIDPATIEQSVADYLDAHPELVTTVQDGSITEAKLASTVLAKLNLVPSLSDEIDDIGSDVTDLKSAIDGMFAQTMSDADVHQVNTSSTEETSSGTRIRILFPVQKGQTFTAQCTGGSGAAISLYDTKNNAIYAGNNYIATYTNNQYTTAEVSGVIEQDGYLAISEKKTDGSSISASEKLALINATSCVIHGAVSILQDEVSDLQDEVSDLQDEVSDLQDEVSGLNDKFAEMDMSDADIHHVNGGSVEETSTGSRLRIVFEVKKGFLFNAICTAGSGVAVSLYDTLYKAVYATDNYITTYTGNAYTLNLVEGEIGSDGYLSISEKKTDGSSITAEQKQALIDATVCNVYGEVPALREQIENDDQTTTTALNKDQETTLVAMSRYNAFLSGNASSATGKKKNLSFAVITDIHGSENAFSRFVDYVNDHQAYFDFAMCLGDIVQTNPANNISWFTDAVPNIRIPFFFTVGNHDVSDTGSSGITQSEARTRYFSAITAKGWLASSDFMGSGKCSWTKDFSDYSIRLISLFEYGNSEETATGSPAAYCRRWIDSDTLQWFANTLYNTPSDYSVVVLLHQVPNNQVTYVDDKFTAIHGFRQEPPHYLNTMDGNPIEEIVNAFITSTSISKTYTSNGTYVNPQKTATVSKDFSGRSNGKFICYICGHAHTAYVLQSSNYSNQKTIVVNTGSENIYQRSYGDLNYDANTRNKDCFYCVGIDTELEKINLVQIGGQVTDDMRKRDFSAIEY